nr:methylated-DNA--[protein]-cysteine S-methyltransferase [Allofustis seminis]
MATEHRLFSVEYGEAFHNVDEWVAKWTTHFGQEAVEEMTPLLESTKKQLLEYFEHKRKIFQLPIDLSVGTEFQQLVWMGLLAIPYGSTMSYKQLAKGIGCPRAIRAAANANGRNPLAIIVPCHRVIYANGQLGGYSSGIEKKQFLLQLEQNKNQND